MKPTPLLLKPCSILWDEKITDNGHEYLRLAITLIMAFIGFWVVNYLDYKREKDNRLKEMRIKYLIESFTKLSNASTRDSSAVSYQRDIESVVSEIQLFGTKEEIQILQTQIDSCIAIQKKTRATILNLDPLLNEFSNSLAFELKMDTIQSNVQWFRFPEKGVDTFILKKLRSIQLQKKME